jgi:hypothetical protein
MKRCLLLLFLFASAVPGWCARKVTVAQLQDLLHSLREDKKSDVETAAALQQVELSEQLTRVVMNGLSQYAPGPLTTEQIYVLEARSSNLLPPASDLPETPAPDTLAREAILARAQTYINKTYEQLPALAARKTTLRFQDNTEALASSSGIGSGAKEAVTSSGMSNPGTFLHYINAMVHPIVLEHGMVKKSLAKDATHWGANGLIEISEPDPGLPRVFKEAQGSGTLHWSRWESISGKPAAVFSFEVPRQQSKLEVNVCCFPDIKQAGVARFYTSSTGPVLGAEKTSGGGVAGNFQTNTDWLDFKASVPYHGRLFIDPETGIVLRMIVETDMKPSDVVHQMDTRIDYGPVKVGQGTFVVPLKSVINSVVVPNGESGAGGYSTRTTLFSSQFSEYHPANSNQ